MMGNGLAPEQCEPDFDAYRALLEHSREGIFRVDAQGVLVFVNQRAADLFGCTVDELAGKNFFDLHFGDDLPRAKKNFASRRLGEAGLSEYHVRRKDGTFIWIAVSSTPVFGAGGAFLGLTGFASDIDERKRREEISEQERRLLRRIAGDASLAEVLADLCKTLEATSRRPLRCTVMLADAARNRLECIAAPSLPQAFRDNRAITQLEGGDTACAQAVRSGLPVIVPDTSAASVSPTLSDMRQAFGFGAVWSYPIIQDDRTLGTLVLLPLATGAPDEEDRQVVDFALQVARLAMAHDLSTKALRISEQRLSDYAGMAADWFWEQDAEFRFTEVSYGPGSRPALPPYCNAGSLGKCRWELPYVNASEAFWEAHRRLLAAGKPFSNLQLQRLDADGDIRTVEISGQPLFDAAGRLLGYRGVGRDITERVRAEAQVRELNATLEERVRARTTELESANQELDAYNYSVSHDLRAPLRSVEGFSQALLEDYANALDDNGRDYLQRIGAATKRMGVLIDAMFHLSRLTRSLMQIRKVDLSAKARAIIEDLRHADPARQVDVKVAPDIAVEGDPDLLRIVLANLLDNAWKYTARAGQARIEFGVVYEREASPVCFVRDNGDGFDMRFADKLFKLFQRLHREDDFAGHGVGLATVQ
ncbi:MAG: PAS domain S-box protein, partial [Rhodocyclaceae bacterium]|nr:PAS domain S-box protein [Rhodocyclaceae bacterium]